MTNQTKKVYIIGTGAFLPGRPVANDEMEDYLGKIRGRPSALRTRILKQNGIRSRHYAIDKNQKSLYRNSEMAALACKAAVEHAGADLRKIEVLACATTQGDLLVPGFGSMVHGELKNPVCEVASLAGVCASGLSAMKYGFQQIKSGEAKLALACASEFPSRLFKASRYENQKTVDDKGRLGFDTEFLRWMLSDGAGAATLSPVPNARGISLEIEWIKLKSHADKYEVCMYAGANTTELSAKDPAPTWIDRPSFEDASEEGFLNLKQDVKRLDTIVNVGIEMFLELIEQRAIHPEDLDWMLCHYSSEKFRSDIQSGLEKCGIDSNRWRWFSNLHDKGNTGSASIYIMLDELLRNAPLKPGQKILCVVPESGRFTVGYMLLTVHGERPSENSSLSPNSDDNDESIMALVNQEKLYEESSDEDPASSLFRKLTRVWLEFDRELAAVPVIKKLHRGTLTKEDYMRILVNFRQQVIDGGRWITRAASNISDEYADVRSLFIRHAADEHMDFRLLEKNYAAVGGDISEIHQAQKNVGSEALSAFIFQRASLPNPFDLIGSMFVIEGLGKFRAAQWGKEIKSQLQLPDEAVTFLAYHGKNDEDHFERLEKAIEMISPDRNMIERIVKTARITARLYRLQLEELDNL